MLNYTEDQLAEYKRELDAIASLSNLFSDNSAPMIYYRATENIYCRSFNAINVSRADCTADAIFDNRIGVGIKTFLHREAGSFQKIAEFNRQQPLFRGLCGTILAKKISELRNERILTTIRTYGLKSMIYHCIVRHDDGTIDVFEEKMNTIDIPNIKIESEEPNRILFTDGTEHYEFYYPKSTLFKQFKANKAILSFKTVVLSDPMELLLRLFDKAENGSEKHRTRVKTELPSLVVPLYSFNKSRGKFVPAKSGLNQWNADGRPRDPDEVYIPFPKSLRTENAAFFPERYTPWDLQLPNGRVISMKVCQDMGKALMSNPNKALGNWILRDVLKIEERHVLTYEELLAKGIDSIIFWKIDNSTFKCDLITLDELED